MMTARATKGDRDKDRDRDRDRGRESVGDNGRERIHLVLIYALQMQDATH